MFSGVGEGSQFTKRNTCDTDISEKNDLKSTSHMPYQMKIGENFYGRHVLNF